MHCQHFLARARLVAKHCCLSDPSLLGSVVVTAQADRVIPGKLSCGESRRSGGTARLRDSSSSKLQESARVQAGQADM